MFSDVSHCESFLITFRLEENRLGEKKAVIFKTEYLSKIHRISFHCFRNTP